jgi:hypothetical protein
VTALPLQRSPLRPVWLILPAAAALGWNVFRLWQFAGFLTQRQDSLMADGMTEAQAMA